MLVFILILFYLFLFGTIGSIFWLCKNALDNADMYSPSVTIIASGVIAIMLVFLHEAVGMIDECEAELSRTEHCEIAAIIVK